MQDPRLRLLSVMVLSAATFLSVQGALLSFLWLFLYPAYLKDAVRSPAFWLLILVTGFISGITFLSGGDGLSYFIRISVIFLLAFTMYRGWKPGEYLDLSVWLFGTKWGFELGLAIEMSLQGLREASRDWSRMLEAMKLKAARPGFLTVPVLGFLLVQTRLVRAQDQADLLLTRGYVHGGSCCPEFHPDRKDSVASILSVFFFILGLFPVRDIFILQM
jgi:energy-coupling factor transporter transmembrane protein EcfT